MLAACLCSPIFAFAETIALKSGKSVEGKLIEKTDKYIKIDFMGVPLTYFLDEVESIDGVVQSQAIEEVSLSPSATVNLSSSDTEQIRKLLKTMDYPENTWPAIERELATFLVKINFPQLKQEAAQVKSDPEQLVQFTLKLGNLFEEEECVNPQNPHPLIRLLVNSFGGEDIFQVIELSQMSPQKKDEHRQSLVACGTVSQLGSIILDLLDINVIVAFTNDHVFNIIPMGDRQVIFADFINGLFKIVELNKYYKVEGSYQVLKDEYRVSPDKMREFKERNLAMAPGDDVVKLLFNHFFFCIYISDDYVATPAIYTNRGNAYTSQGKFVQAISDFNKAIQINPKLAMAYTNRGVVYYDQGNFTQAISDYYKAIEINPNDALAYYNIGLVYGDQGKFSQAISVYNAAIKINPNYADAYFNRGLAFYIGKEYDKAWADVHKAEALGFAINPNFLDALKKASGRDR